MGRSTIFNLVKRIVWSRDKQEYEVVVTDRISPRGETALRGDEIMEISRMGAIVTSEGTQIPLHRVKRIVYRGKVIFDREQRIF